MNDTRFKYWDECVSNAIEDCGLVATREQIKQIAAAVESAHENYGLAFYSPPMSELPVFSELETAKKELKREREKVFCKACDGSGRIVSSYGIRSSNSGCWKCDGNGRHDP